MTDRLRWFWVSQYASITLLQGYDIVKSGCVVSAIKLHLQYFIWSSNPILTLKYNYNIQRIALSDPLIGTRENQQNSRLQQTDERIQPTEWWTQREWFQLLIQCKLKRFNSGLSENGSRFSVEGLSPPPSLQTEVSSADCLCFQHLVVQWGRCVPHCSCLLLLWAPRFWVWVWWAQDCKPPLTPIIQHRSDGF